MPVHASCASGDARSNQLAARDDDGGNRLLDDVGRFVPLSCRHSSAEYRTESGPDREFRNCDEVRAEDAQRDGNGIRNEGSERTQGATRSADELLRRAGSGRRRRRLCIRIAAQP